MRLVKELETAAMPVWKAMLAHPFMQGLANGSLPDDIYAFYLAQNYPYLVEYARVLGTACGKTNDLPFLRVMADMLEKTLGFELALNRKNAAQLGISEETLLASELAPNALAYVNFLHYTANAGGPLQICAALYPCPVSYCLLARWMLEQGAEGGLAHPLYGEWIRGYSSEETQVLSLIHI